MCRWLSGDGAACALSAKMSGDAAEEQRQIQLHAELEQRLSQLRQEVAAADRRVQELQKALADRKANPQAIRVITAGNAAWVECVGDGVVFLPDGKRVSLDQLRDSPMLFLSGLGNRPLQFLVRPDGFRSFEAAREAAEQHGIASLGYEPVDADWRFRVRAGGRQP